MIIVISIILLILCILNIPRSRHYVKLKKAKKVYTKIQTIEDHFVIPYLRKIDPFVFEELVLLAFRKKGYKTYRNTRYTGDGGLDGKVKIDGTLYLIQDKRYKNYICAEHVKAFDELCAKRKAKGIFVHTGKTGKESREVAWESPRLKIISGKNLVNLLKENN